MVQNYALSDSVARRCLEICQDRISKERRGAACWAGAGPQYMQASFSLQI